MRKPDIEEGKLAGVYSHKKTSEEVEEFLKNRGLAIEWRGVRSRRFIIIKVPDGLEAAWREKLLQSGYFEDLTLIVDFDSRTF